MMIGNKQYRIKIFISSKDVAFNNINDNYFILSIILLNIYNIYGKKN